MGINNSEIGKKLKNKELDMSSNTLKPKKNALNLSKYKTDKKNIDSKFTTIQVEKELIDKFKMFIKKNNLNVKHGVLMRDVLKDFCDE